MADGQTTFGDTAVQPGSQTAFGDTAIQSPTRFRDVLRPTGRQQVQGAVNTFLQGLTFNFSDEVGAAAVAAAGIADYDTALEIIRENKELFEAERPGTALALEAAGGLTTGVAAAPAVIGANVPRAALPTAARLGTAGAAAGATAGFGAGEGGFQERVQSAIPGAVAGGALGIVLPPIGRAAATRLQGLINRIPAARRQAFERIQRALARDEMTVPEAQAQLGALGVNATIADIAGENVRGLARAAQSMPGRARNVGKDVLEARQAQQPDRVAETLNRTLGEGQSFRTTRDDLIAQRHQAAQPLYEQAYAQDIPFTDELQTLFQRPAIQDAWNTARRIAANEGVELPEGGPPTMQTIDYLKRALDDFVERNRNELTGAVMGDDARAVAGVRRELLDLVDDLNPAYKAARSVYAGQSAAIDAMDQGRRLGLALSRRGDPRFDPEQILAEVARMSDGEKAMFRQGLARGIMDIVEGTTDRADAIRKIIGTPAQRRRLQAAFEDAEGFTRFMSDMMREAQFARTTNEVLSNSITSRLAAEQADLLQNAPQQGALGMLLEGRPAGAAARGVGRAVEAFRRPSPQVAEELAMMFQQGPAARQVLQQAGSVNAIPPALQRVAMAALLESQRQAGTRLPSNGRI